MCTTKRNEDEKWLRTTRLCDHEQLAVEREVVTLATFHAALAWKHISEQPTEKRISPMTVVYPAEAEGLKAVLSAGAAMADQQMLVDVFCYQARGETTQDAGRSSLQI
jgi:hypothetical protein